MRKRNAKIQEFISANGAKQVCAKFGPKTHAIIASGDDKNVVSLWKLNKDRPLMTLTSQSTTSSVASEISAINFNMNETEVYSGTNRGALSVWDIEAQKLNNTLKGHAAAINCITAFASDDKAHLLLTGSYDSSIKLWDLRQKETVQSFKGHDMQINCIEVTPDNKWIATGAQDGLIKIWDIATGRSLQTFNLHDGPVTSIKFNPYDLTLASGSTDKTIKYWDLEKFGLISSTKAEATGIQAMTFDPDGRFLYSAAQDTLRVWHVDADDLCILDNVEATWRGVQDLAIQVNPKTEEETLVGIAITNVSFGLWCCPLKTVNKDPTITPEKFLQMRKAAEAKLKPTTPPGKQMDQPFAEPEKAPLHKQKSAQEKPYKQESRPEVSPPRVDKKKPFVSQSHQNIFPSADLQAKPTSEASRASQGMQPVMSSYQGFMKDDDDVQKPYQQPNAFKRDSPVMPSEPQNFVVQGQGNIVNPYEANRNNVLPPRDFQRQNSKENVPLEKRPSNDRVGQVNVHDPSLLARLQDNNVREEKPTFGEDNSMNQTAAIIDVKNLGHDQLNLSSLIKGSDNSDKNLILDTISEVAKDHPKFNAYMKQRLDNLELILHYWNSGNVRSALNAINSLNISDTTLIMDLLYMSSAVNKTGMNIEASVIFLQKAVMLLESKFDHHVKMGFKFINKTFKQYYDEIVKIKCAPIISSVDIAREERVKKYDKLIDEFEAISKKDRLKKLASKNKDEVGEYANRLLADLDIFLSKVRPNK